jgi:molecular chaperone GrpE (heat shock protein)
LAACEPKPETESAAAAVAAEDLPVSEPEPPVKTLTVEEMAAAANKPAFGAVQILAPAKPAEEEATALAEPAAEAPKTPQAATLASAGLAGMWSELKALLFAPDFPLDEEKPEEIRPSALRWHLSAFSGPETGADESKTEVKSESPSGSDTKFLAPDAISMVSELMRREEASRREAELAKLRAAAASEGGGDNKQMVQLMKQLLTVLDSLERIAEAGRGMTPSPELANWLKSIDALYARALSVLERFGLAQMRSLGQVVNLDYHEVIEYRPSPNHPANTIIAEPQKGYVFNNRLLRDAKVVVAMPMRRK